MTRARTTLSSRGIRPSAIQRAHGRQGAVIQAVSPQGVEAGRADVQGIEENAQHVIRGIGDFGHADPADGSAVENDGHAGAEALIEGAEQGFLQADSQIMEGGGGAVIFLKQGDEGVRKVRKVHKGGAKAGPQRVANQG